MTEKSANRAGRFTDKEWGPFDRGPAVETR